MSGITFRSLGGSAAARLTRRELLKLGAVGTGALLFPEALLGQHPFGGLPGGILRQPGRQEERQPVVAVHIDPHTHIFNARDIAVAAFIREVVVNPQLNFFKKLYLWIFLAPVLGRFEDDLDAAAVFVDLLTKKAAPTIQEEKKKLEDFLSKHERESQREIEAAFYCMASEENYALWKEMHSIVERALTKHVRKKFDEEERDLILRFLTRVVAMRYQNAAQLMELYGGPQATNNGKIAQGISLFTPSLIDMGLWLGDDEAFPMEAHIEVLSHIARLSGGRILPVIAFDPWRQAFGAEGGADRGKPLQWAKQAVEKCGFAGVKLYPPMGFHPLGNQKYDSNKKHWPEKARRHDRFGTGLDTALRELYEWCQREEVPILTHANRTMGAGKGYDKRAAPEGWELVLKDYPGLRVSFGHFGGWDAVKKGGGWSREFARLMLSYPNVYGDVGSFGTIGEDKKRNEFSRGLGKLLKKFPALRERILYASDWFMETSTDYYKDFHEALWSLDGTLTGNGEPALSERFFGGNAAEFLGLHKGNKARERLEEFYRRQNFAPAWIERLDASR